MKVWLTLALVTVAAASEVDRGVVASALSPHVRLKAVNLDDVRWTGGFWARWYETNRASIAPVIWRAMNDPRNGATFTNFLIATGKTNGTVARTDWNDGDVYKYVETIASIYATTKDPSLDRHMDELIAVFSAAQEPDGYLSTPIKLKNLKRWSNLKHHELYNMGHLMTAACIHHRVTGKTNFLKVATRLADYLYTVFAPKPKELAHFGFNPSQIMGLTELYRTTRNPKYLELAGIFVDMRGSQPGGTDQNQQRIPLRKETQAVGHAVTANYLYAGAADVAAETGEPALMAALQRIWSDMSSKRVYVTGAVGSTAAGLSRHRDPIHEAFGTEYELPNRLAYTETCANIANAMWNWRMLALTGEVKYADMMEVVLYNSMLSGVGVDGQGFYYNNPIRRHGGDLARLVRPGDPALRDPILGCYCCPPNISRTLAQLQGWAYSKGDASIWVNLFGSSTLHTKVGSSTVKLSVRTDYPWDGRVTLRIDEAPRDRELTIHLRIPAWAEGAVLRSGNTVTKTTAGSYAPVRKLWTKGDVIELDLPVKPRLVVASRFVEAARNQVAVMLGPLVYALESPDLPAGVQPDEVVIPSSVSFRPRYDAELLGGVAVLEGDAYQVPRAARDDLLYSILRPSVKRPIQLRLIPYYAWANRGMSHMSVWLPVDW